MNKILAIDPGTTQSALVVWDGEKIESARKMPNAEVMANIGIFCTLQALEGTAVYCERIESYGMACGREVFETCFWTGRFWEATANCKEPFLLIPRREVKLHLCGQARAKDSNIIQALRDRFGEKGTKKNPGLTFGLKADLWQAFALAVTCWDLKSEMEKYLAK